MSLPAEERSSGLSAAARVMRKQLISAAEDIASNRLVNVIEAPAPASLMVELEVPVGAFCLTEVVVTTCSVEVDGRPGWAAVMGWDDEAGLAAAIVDTEPTIADPLAAGALGAEESGRRKEAALIAATKVVT